MRTFGQMIARFWWCWEARAGRDGNSTGRQSEMKKGGNSMQHPSLDTLATRLAAHLDCTQDVACRQIMRAMAETGQPLAPVHLARRLQISQQPRLRTEEQLLDVARCCSKDGMAEVVIGREEAAQVEQAARVEQHRPHDAKVGVVAHLVDTTATDGNLDTAIEELIACGIITAHPDQTRNVGNDCLTDARVRIVVDLGHIAIVGANQDVTEVVVRTEKTADVDDALKGSKQRLSLSLIRIEKDLDHSAIGCSDDGMAEVVVGAEEAAYADHIGDIC